LSPSGPESRRQWNNGDGSGFREGQSGNDSLFVNNGDGSDFLEAEDDVVVDGNIITAENYDSAACLDAEVY
jgi:putative intracellular protease/amidase